MAGLVAVIYGVVAYSFTLVALLYLIGFVGNLIVPKSIDSGTAGPLIQSVVVDVMLIALFAIQHSVMARQGFKRWWTRIVPALGRAQHLCAVHQFRAADPVLAVAADSSGGLDRAESDRRRDHSTASSGWVGSCSWPAPLCSTILSCLGSARCSCACSAKRHRRAKFRTPLLYRHVRHPILLGVLLAVWATPAMTAGHLLFAVVITGHILIGIQLEERDLIQQFGDRYRRYRQHAAMLIPIPGRKFTDAKDADV